MAVKVSSMFLKDEMSFCEMVANGGIFVGDRWFAKDSPEIERAKYHAVYLRRQERNKRRRDRRKESAVEHRQRPAPRRLAVDPDSLVGNRMPLERRKCNRRSTISECPTANEIRTAWHFRNVSPESRVRLGGMLMDLECYVDNSLIMIVHRNRAKIVGRRGGLKQWIREKCPELEPHYKTLQRIKGIAKRLRQRLDVLDPIPVSVILNREVTMNEIVESQVHVQPRRAEARPVQYRFAWELSSPHYDADGRMFYCNGNYSLAYLGDNYDFYEHISAFRSLLASAISLNDEEKCTIETYSRMERRGLDLRGFVRDGLMDPGFWKDVGREFVKDFKRDVGEAFLAERTMRLIAQGRKVGIGQVVLGWLMAYMDFYDSALVYKWGRVSRKEMDEW